MAIPLSTPPKKCSRTAAHLVLLWEKQEKLDSLLDQLVAEHGAAKAEAAAETKTETSAPATPPEKFVSPKK